MPKGRPRDPSIDERALAATRELVVEHGLDAATVQAVAERAGLQPSALYRRWPTRADLIRDAAFRDLDPVTVRPTGDLGRDLERFVGAYLRTFRSPLVQAALPGLLASAGSGTPPASAWRVVSIRPQFADIVAAAQPPVDPDVDLDAAFDLLLGVVLARVLVPSHVHRAPAVGRTVELLVRMLR